MRVGTGADEALGEPRKKSLLVADVPPHGVVLDGQAVSYGSEGQRTGFFGYRGVDAAGRLRSRLTVRSASSVARATTAGTVCQTGPAEARLVIR